MKLHLLHGLAFCLFTCALPAQSTGLYHILRLRGGGPRTSSKLSDCPAATARTGGSQREHKVGWGLIRLARVTLRSTGRYGNSFFLLASPPNGAIPVATVYEGRYDFPIQRASRLTANGYSVEVAVPLSYVTDRQGKDWRTLRINVISQDEDTGQEDMLRTSWMPEWGGAENVVGSGLFYRK